jgi:hypothetical protein
MANEARFKVVAKLRGQADRIFYCDRTDEMKRITDSLLTYRDLEKIERWEHGQKHQWRYL